MAKNLLCAWLTVELSAKGWEVRFDLEHGISLIRGQCTAKPSEILNALERGENEIPNLGSLLADESSAGG